MLIPNDRVLFFDVMVALVRKVVSGRVRTGYLFEGLEGNPAFKLGVDNGQVCTRMFSLIWWGEC